MPKGKRVNIREKIIQAALQLATDRGWSACSIPDIAAAARVSVSAVIDTIGGDDKNAVLTILIMDAVKGLTPDLSSDDPAHDRIFAVLMALFDKMQQDRVGWISVVQDTMTAPCALKVIMPTLARSIAKAVEAAGVKILDGPIGSIKIAVLTGIFIFVIKTWMRDETEDLGAVMAALDISLTRMEQVAIWAQI